MAILEIDTKSILIPMQEGRKLTDSYEHSERRLFDEVLHSRNLGSDRFSPLN